jgi:hypothetical protein
MSEQPSQYLEQRLQALEDRVEQRLAFLEEQARSDGAQTRSDIDRIDRRMESVRHDLSDTAWRDRMWTGTMLVVFAWLAAIAAIFLRR